ncbi:YhdP family protein [Aquibaculum arenosum]|uniref:AsmA-like C-terminal region-containing protein n=1 Tax=Aquibaculum arenosum TaxID=3032591 RepID=A0ABT5YIW3_9PROT|nr:AsmA-like C-terminal region-containing protein [Fodinicurvata sp. CAU 1616]MDF2094881.1 AsmA-like C-terminal region-containing protein [Fodinicurvata sp. CAU 1616]
MRVNRFGRVLLEVMGGAVALLVVVLLIVFWRLTAGPVPMDFLAPRIEQAFAGEGVVAEVGSTALIWDGSSREIQVEARNWRLRDSEGQPLAYLPRVELTLSLEALLHGTFGATRIELDRARLRVLRDEEGAFAFGAPPADSDEVPDLSGVADDVLAQLLEPRDPDKAITYLQHIDIRNARLLFDDRRVGRRIELRQGGIQIWREVGGIGAQVQGEAAFGQARAALRSSLWFRSDQQVVESQTQFEDLRVNEFAPWSGFAELDGIELGLSGQLQANVPIDGRLPSGTFEIASDGGRIDLTEVFARPFDLLSLSARGAFDGAGGTFGLEQLDLHLGNELEPGPRLSASADVREGTNGLRVTTEASVEHVLVPDLHLYWPTILRDGGRPWVVENIPVGEAPEGRVAADVTLPKDPTAEPLVHRLDGSFSFRDLEVHYLRPLPPAVGLHGTATFDADSFNFVVENGGMQELAVSGGDVVISGLQEPDQWLDVSFDAVGPLRTVLETLEHPRLDLLAELGFTSEGSAGQANARLRFVLPLEDEVTFDDIDLGVDGTVSEVLLRQAVLGEDLSGGPLSLSLTQHGMQVSGDLALGDTQAYAVNWSEAFEGGGERTQVTASIPHLGQPARERLGVDLAPYLTGPVAAEIDLGIPVQGDSRLDLNVDLAEAAVQIEELDWDKPSGVPGRFTGRLLLRDELPTAIEDMSFDAEGLTMSAGLMTFDELGEPNTLNLGNANFGNSSLQALTLRFLSDGGLEAEIGSGQLDVEDFLGDEEAETQAGTDVQEPEVPDSTLRIVAPNVSQLRFAENRFLEAAELRLFRDAAGWQEAVLRGQVPRHLWRRGGGAADEGGPKTVSLIYGDAAGRVGKALQLQADDFGAMLRAIDLFDTLEGGSLSVVGSGEGPLPDHPMTFELWADDYTLVEAPAMARLLTIASLTGIGELLGGDGITFQRLTGEVVLADGRLSSDLVRAYGPALGITARGHLDLEGANSDVRGTLVPAYSLNQVLGAIPLLGFLLTGGEGEGILGVNYRLSGSLEDPQFSVNPLSALAPGFLRNLFNLPAASSDSEEEEDNRGFDPFPPESMRGP